MTAAALKAWGRGRDIHWQDGSVAEVRRTAGIDLEVVAYVLRLCRGQGRHAPRSRHRASEKSHGPPHRARRSPTAPGLLRPRWLWS
eukprot:1569040-Alexandrium_andersonii.AAC.1